MKLLPLSLLCGALAMSANAATLIHYYPFTVDVSDQVGTEHGTLQNGASVSGGVLNLDGTNDYASFAAHLIPGTGSFSVLLSSRLGFAGPVGGIMEMISQGASGSAFYLGPNGTGTRVGDNWPSAFTPFPSDGLWHNYAVTVDAVNDVTRLYVDGSQVGFINIEIGHGTSGTNTFLGKQYNGHSEYWNGQIDNVRIYSDLLTAGEVAAIHSGASEVPEPWTMALTGAGLIVVGLSRKLRAKHHHAG
jgi:hypothetical protein